MVADHERRGAAVLVQNDEWGRVVAADQRQGERRMLDAALMWAEMTENYEAGRMPQDG